MNKEKLKELIKSKEGITLVGVITLLLVITIINVAVKDTHAYYNSVTDPVQIFNSKVGDFKPKITSFYIKQTTTPKYTNAGGNTVYITPGTNNKNIDQVCITETNNVSSCTWQNIVSNNQYSYAFANTNTEGNKTIFGFVKDKYGNKSISSSDVITYDKTLPVINKFYIKNEDATKYTNLQANTVYFTYTETNPQDMCVTEGTDTKNCTWVTVGKSTSYTFTNTTEGAKTVRGYVRDKAGNISSVKTSAIIYDVTPPTVTKVTAPTINETNLTLSITANDNKIGVSPTSGIEKYCYSQKNSAKETDYTCVTSASIVVNSLKAGTSYTFYVYAKDKAGNSGIANRVHYAFKTKESGPIDYLRKYATGANGVQTLQTTAVDGMYRYYGTKDEVTNNYICLGSTSTDKCQDGRDMYRIIGITTDGKLKVIHDRYGVYGYWGYLYSKVIWNESDLYTNLNGEFYNSINTRIKGLIEKHTWNMEQTKTYPWTSKTTGKQDGTVQAYIGLMYASDYYNSWDYPSEWSDSAFDWPGDYSNANSWLYSCKESCWEFFEWTMSRYGMEGDTNEAWAIYQDGRLAPLQTGHSRTGRYVFYLQSSVTLTGSGISTDPFRVQ